MGNSNKYWKGIDELEGTLTQSTSANEFSEGLPLDEVFSGTDALSSNRRDFLKYFGFSVSAVALAACNKAPVKYAIPYVEKPENVTPGVALYYATNCGVYNEGFPILAKVREGRPIKLDGNDLSSLSQGGLSAAGQASILSLYDTNRLPNPVVGGEEVEDWAEADKKVIQALEAANAKGIRLVHRTETSPLMADAIAQFKTKYPNTETIVYDPISYGGILNANATSFGKRIIPNYHFDKAEVVVSFGADFLGTWISPTRFSSDYMKLRRPSEDAPNMSRHYQIEALMSLTGSNADYRYPMNASKEGALVASLYKKLGGEISGSDMNLPANSLDKIAADLLAAKGKSLVVSGSNDANIQNIVNAINEILGNYGSTIDMSSSINVSAYDDVAFDKFASDVKAGNLGAVVFLNTNPVYSYNGGAALANNLKNIPTVITTSMTLDETAEHAGYNCPDNHFLESWDVKEPVSGKFTFSQPVISKVFNTRSAIASLINWSGTSATEESVMGMAKTYVEGTLGANWNKAIHDGFVDKGNNGISPTFNAEGVSSAAASSKNAGAGVELVLYQKVGPLDGTWSLNPWSHELPDPVTKVCYDNYVSISKSDADQVFKLEQGDFVKVSVNGMEIDRLPVLIQPGQAIGTVGIALGYGRKLPETVKNDLFDLGKNAYHLVGRTDGTATYTMGGVSLEKVGSGYEFAQTQTHWSIEGRDLIREASLGEYKANPKVRNEHSPHIVSLWDEYDYSSGHHWGMAIDLNACTGCGSCIVSCSIENNVPPVGRDEVRMRREMHWIRIDRYYSFNLEADAEVQGEKHAAGDALTREHDIDAHAEAGNYDHYNNVSTMHVPMMCQHCDHAPCETVCPVLATTHSSEGLNQMTYNRCIGTKYCGNNCPYKVRRFNWFRYNLNPKFDYHFNNELGRMVLNPDVTVRSRGVMEKCSFCIQNIQTAKLEAKRENRKLEDGAVKVACAKACPTNAIVFGDRNDPNSKIAKLYQNKRSYKMLEETDVQPSVTYMTKIRNTESNKVHA